MTDAPEDISVAPSELLLSAEPVQLTVEARAHGWRLDHYLCRLFPNYSRALFQSAINEQAVLVNGLDAKPSKRLRVNDRISVRLPERADSTLPAEDIPLDVLYEDASLIVLNKQADMIVHPGKGNYRGTLAGALQFHFDSLSDMAGSLRPGIVHRLDKDTSGVLVVAKDNQVHHRLSTNLNAAKFRRNTAPSSGGICNSRATLSRLTCGSTQSTARKCWSANPVATPARPARFTKSSNASRPRRRVNSATSSCFPKPGGRINFASTCSTSGIPSWRIECTAAGRFSSVRT